MKTRWKKQVFTTKNQITKAVEMENKKQIDQIQEETFVDAAQQMTAVMLYTLHLMGWRKKRLLRFFKEMAQVYEFMRSGIMNGQKFDCDDCIRFIKEKYDIDLIKEISVETKTRKEH